MVNKMNCQDTILEKLCIGQTPCTVYLMNGYPLNCTIITFDDSVLVVTVDEQQQMIYKHAISTITPHYSFQF